MSAHFCMCILFTEIPVKLSPTFHQPTLRYARHASARRSPGLAASVHTLLLSAYILNNSCVQHFTSHSMKEMSDKGHRNIRKTKYLTMKMNIIVFHRLKQTTIIINHQSKRLLTVTTYGPLTNNTASNNSIEVAGLFHVTCLYIS